MRRWFLSYHSPDQALAEQLKAAIERKDAAARVFFAPTHLRAGGGGARVGAPSAQMRRREEHASRRVFAFKSRPLSRSALAPESGEINSFRNQRGDFKAPCQSRRAGGTMLLMTCCQKRAGPRGRRRLQDIELPGISQREYGRFCTDHDRSSPSAKIQLFIENACCTETAAN